MILTVDNIANRYGFLPSQVINEATTFDLFVSDVVVRFQNRQQKLAQGIKDPAPKLTQDEMLDMVRKVKERKSANR